MAPVELFCGLTSNKKQIFYKPKSDERITSYWFSCTYLHSPFQWKICTYNLGLRCQ